MRFFSLCRPLVLVGIAGLFLAAYLPAAAQPADQVDTVYLDKHYHRARNSGEARYYLLELKDARLPHGIIRYYYLDGGLAAEITYKKGVQEGETTYFYPNGNIRGTGSYRQDQQVGQWQWWYANGKLKLVQQYPEEVKPYQPDPAPRYQTESFRDSTGTLVFSDGTGAYVSYHDNGRLEEKGQFVDGYRHGPWTGYHEDGQLYYEEEWKAGELVAGKSYSEDGTQSYTYRQAAEMPAHRGGLPGLARYLSRTLRYPATARKARIQGEVVIGFTVDEQGAVVDAKVLKSLGGGCDEEALRVMRGMEKWEPGRVKGRPVMVAYILPLRFVMQ
jgi:TonB family protein